MDHVPTRRRIARKYQIGSDTLIEYNKSILSNGIILITEKIPWVESFSLGLCINAGSRDDFSGKEGIAHFIEHLIFRNPKFGNSSGISSRFDSIGAEANAFTTKEYTLYHVRALKSHLRSSLKLLTGIVYNAHFNSKSLEDERKIIIEEINSLKDDPEEVLIEMADSHIFSGNSIGEPIAGSVGSVKAINISSLREYYRKYYKPGNSIISVVGNIDHNNLVKLIESFIQLGQDSNDGIIERRKQDLYTPKRINEKRKTNQSYIVFGRRVSEIISDERFTLLVLNELFAYSMSSRLQKKIREKLGLAYSLDSSVYFYSDTGVIYISLSTDPVNTDKAVNEIFKEIIKLNTLKFSASEIRRAKEQLMASTVMDGESLSERMRILLRNQLYAGKRETLSDTITGIESVTLEDICEAVSKYFNPDDWSLFIFSSEE